MEYENCMVRCVQRGAEMLKLCNTCKTKIFDLIRQDEPQHVEYVCENGHKGQFRITHGHLECVPIQP